MSRSFLGWVPFLVFVALALVGSAIGYAEFLTTK
jgi:hypothetical protein